MEAKKTKIPLHNLQANIYYTKPVYLDEKYILLSPDTPFPAPLLENLRKWHFNEVYTAGNPANEAPLADDLGQDGSAVQENSAQEDQYSEEAQKFYQEAMDAIEKIFNTFKEKGEFRQSDVTDLTKEIYTALRNNRRYILALQNPSAKDHDYITKSAVRTAVLSLA